MNRARILIVEDEELVGLAIRTFLESVGFEIPSVVPSGERALEEVASLEPDLVLMDIRLSGEMDGIEAAARIREGYRLPVIYLTAYSDAETLKKAKATEPFGYVLKPFDERTLEVSIEMALHKAALQRKIEQNRERLETILQSLGDGIIVAGMEGFIEYINSTALTLLKLTAPVPSSTPIVRLLKVAANRSQEPAALPLDEVLLNGKSVSYRGCVLATEGGARRTVDLNLDPHRDRRGVVRGVVLSFRDVSEPWKMRELVEAELHPSSFMHRGLLPADGTAIGPSRMHGFLFPATFGAGDLYNFYRIDESHAGLYIVDVVGHGIPAASTALLVSRLLTPNPARGNTLCLLGTDSLSPREVVSKMNDFIHSAEGGIFFTMCYGVIDLPTRRLRLVRAGHPFPILVRGGGQVEEIEAGGYAVGLSPDFQAEETDIPLSEGDRLFLYSDGLTDCADPDGTHFSRGRLLELIRATRGDQLSEAVARVGQQVVSWRGKESYDDDITFLGIELAEEGDQE